MRKKSGARQREEAFSWQKLLHFSRKINPTIHLGFGVYPQYPPLKSHIDFHNRKPGYIRSFQGRAPRANSKRSPIRQGAAI
jgi:hypothetical protein